jgi:hypothetical protein
MYSNSNSFNGNSAICLAAADDPTVRSLPLLFRYLIPGFEAGWPAR